VSAENEKSGVVAIVKFRLHEAINIFLKGAESALHSARAYRKIFLSIVSP
jgi:hypothetical protein